MRIVHISDCYLPKLGGIEVQVDGLAAAQAMAGHEVHVITATRKRDGGMRETGIHGVQVHRLTAPMPADLPVHPFAHRVIANRLSDLRPDVVHAHVGAVSQFAWAGIWAAHRLGIPVLSTVHSIWGPLARSAYRLAGRLVGWQEWGELSAVSRAAADLVAAAAGRPVLVTGNGVDLGVWRSRPRRPTGRLHFVSATRFAPRKRVLPLLRVVRNLRAELGDDCPRFTIAGSGPSWRRAQRLVRKWGLGSVVELPGRLDRAALQQLFDDADLFVQLSVRESFGLAAIEARAAGLPVVGRSGNGFAEFVTDGETGRLLATDAAVAVALAQLVREPGELQRLQANCHNQPPVHTWQHAMASVDSAYGLAMAHRLR